MNTPIDDFLSDWLDDADQNPDCDGVVSVGDSNESVAESLLIHGLLTDVGTHDDAQEAARIRELMQRIDSEVSVAKVAKTFGTADPKPKLLTSFATVLAIVAAVMLMFVLFGSQQSVSAAMASLDKVVQAAMKPIDRTYTVHLVEEYPRDKRPRNMSQDAWQREAPEQIDGATIFVRGVNEYVMTVLLKTGVKRTSGCDGKLSWSFRENGPVHVSTDLSRFRGGMPGNQQDMPFLNIHASLSRLKIGYDVELMEQQDTAADGTVFSMLSCVRKSDDVRGVKRVDVWFDAESGTVHKMLLDGLPRGRGGPKSVMLELIDQSELPDKFYSHESHHEAERRVKSE